MINFEKKLEKMALVIFYCFPCIYDRNKATNKKYTLHERKFYTFYAKIVKNRRLRIQRLSNRLNLTWQFFCDKFERNGKKAFHHYLL